MKTIYKKTKIHFLYYIVALLAILTGLFKDFIILSLLIFIHEMGHVLMALYHSWDINKIIILPFGGLTIFKEHLNKPLKEEFMILIMGPLFQTLFYLLAFYLKPNDLLTNYHYALLLFNMLPIIPLDGSKLVNLISNLFFSFKVSHLMVIYLSILFLGGILLYNLNNLIILLVFSFLIIKVIWEYKYHNYIFNKFLVERFIYKFKFRKTKVIKGLKLSKMFRDYNHDFIVGNKLYKEEEVLKQRFDKSKDL